MYWDFSYHLLCFYKWLFLMLRCGAGSGPLCTIPNTTTFSTIYGLSPDVSPRRCGGVLLMFPAFYAILTPKHFFSGVETPLNKQMCGSNCGGGPSSCCFGFNSPIVYFLRKIHHLMGIVYFATDIETSAHCVTWSSSDMIAFSSLVSSFY